MSVSSGQGYIIKDGVRVPGLYAWKDYNTASISLAPPVQNQWYEVLHVYRCTLNKCALIQTNTELASKDCECRWTIDGTVYTVANSGQTNNTMEYVYRGILTSAEIYPLIFNSSQTNAGYFDNVYGQDFKVEVRIHSAPGTAQTLKAYCVYSTLEAT
jgi:hypothetical protein